MKLLQKIKQEFICLHKFSGWPQHCELFENGDYTYTCQGCNKVWTRLEIEKIHKVKS